MTDSLRERPLGERLAELLRKQILNGDLAPGTEIRQEALARQYEVSRIPVREALQNLERDGFVVVKPNRRVVIAEVTSGDLNDHYEARALIEGALAKRAAAQSRGSADLREAYLVGEKLLGTADTGALVRANEIFHRAVWEASGSTRLYALANQLWTGIPPYRAFLFPEGIRASIEEHSRILEAINSGDEDLAQEHMSQHILGARDDVLRARQTQAPAEELHT
ncbi:GntR family transcriptional regulator [Nesterenkonia sphaerica]|uniref:GntR family transcriptional regulator n=1 Tax=Nesterenkonia sphaerica TaxID=1804988 RepID=A0A5R9A497_9MICC|nr:GntR family transcriptional regulator [Nesterenkonia sphaerica]TLP72875.1 GntR family transcriptional regulator [Nesterenkonia sphaerica]